MHLDRCPTTGDEVGVAAADTAVNLGTETVRWPCPCGGVHDTPGIAAGRLFAFVGAGATVGGEP